VNALGVLFSDPLCELLKASLGVREDLVLELSYLINEADIELQFSDVDAECGNGHKRRLLCW
jgi:hypothetical protein